MDDFNSIVSISQQCFILFLLTLNRTITPFVFLYRYPFRSCPIQFSPFSTSCFRGFIMIDLRRNIQKFKHVSD